MSDHKELSAADQERYGEAAARLRLAIARLFRLLRLDSPGDLNLTQWSALAAIEEHQPIRIGDIAEYENVSPAGATRVVAFFEQENLVVREGDPTDRRVMWVSLTSEGRARLAWARTVVMSALADRLIANPMVDLDRLLELLPILEAIPDGPNLPKIHVVPEPGEHKSAG